MAVSRVVFVGVLLIRVLLRGVCIGAPDFWKLTYQGRSELCVFQMASFKQSSAITQRIYDM